MRTRWSSSGSRLGRSPRRRLALTGALALALAAMTTQGMLGAESLDPALPGAPPPPPIATAVPRRITTAVRMTYRVPVLMYHRITCAPRGAPLPGLWVCPRDLDRTMRLLRARGWTTITGAELADARAAGRPLPRRTFVIVFDDGNRDGYDRAYPILERYGFQGVFAVVVGRVDVKRRAMTWAELRELQEAGHEIANHSMSHANVARLDRAGLAREVGRSAARLRRHLGAWPRTFVYPYGSWDRSAMRAVRAAHHSIAFTTVSGATSRSSDRLSAPRVRISRGDSPEGIMRRLSAFD
jgi:peptidoglycan/xylan/chitin deacetylase (PgdA/CDA1 family)